MIFFSQTKNIILHYGIKIFLKNLSITRILKQSKISLKL